MRGWTYSSDEHAGRALLLHSGITRIAQERDCPMRCWSVLEYDKKRRSALQSLQQPSLEGCRAEEFQVITVWSALSAAFTPCGEFALQALGG